MSTAVLGEASPGGQAQGAEKPGLDQQVAGDDDDDNTRHPTGWDMTPQNTKKSNFQAIDLRECHSVRERKT